MLRQVVYQITLTPISRPLVKGANIFLAAPAANSVVRFFKQLYSNRARFFGLLAAYERLLR